MSETSTRPRVDIYTATHKGVRLLIAQTAKEIQTADYTSPEEVERVASAVDRALEFMDQHAQAEDQVIHGALRDVEPDLVASLEKEHRELDAAADKVRSAVAALRAATNGASAASITALDRAFSCWMGGHLVHMVHEEEKSLPALWKHFDDPKIIGIRSDIQKGMAPERLTEWMRLFFRGMSAPEVGDMLIGAKMGAPPPVFERMSRLAEEELGPRWPAAKQRARL